MNPLWQLNLLIFTLLLCLHPLNWCCLCCSLVGCQAHVNRTRIETTLIKALFKDYDPRGRPVLNLSEPVLVKFGLAYSNLHSLVSINTLFNSKSFSPGANRWALKEEFISYSLFLRNLDKLFFVCLPEGAHRTGSLSKLNDDVIGYYSNRRAIHFWIRRKEHTQDFSD